VLCRIERHCLCLPLFLVLPSLASASATTELFSFKDDQSATKYVEQNSAIVAQVAPADIAALVERGWFSAARQLVTASHGSEDKKQQELIASAVRQETASLKHQCDNLLETLTVQKEIGSVNCAFQWSQNRSHLFLNVKFSHRWSSPGCLKVKNNQISATDRFFNFSADGEHSGLKKRYRLDLHLYSSVVGKKLTWHMASVGHMTAIVGKKKHDRWPRLLSSPEKPKNMAAWSDMDEKWKEDLRNAPIAPEPVQSAVEEASALAWVPDTPGWVLEHWRVCLLIITGVGIMINEMGSWRLKA